MEHLNSQQNKKCTNENEGRAISVDSEEQKDKRNVKIAKGISGSSLSGTIYVL